MSDRTVKVTLKAEIGQYQTAMRSAEQAALKAGQATQKAGQDTAQGTQKMATSATAAATATDKLGAATDKVGQSLKGTVGDVDKFGNALSEADVAAGRYVNNGGRVVEANGQMAAGFGKAREATEQATESADRAAGAWGRLSETALKNEQAWSTVSTALLGIGAAALAGPAMAVKTFADFDAAMSSVQSATHSSAEEMDQLGAAAVKAGADTAYSAEEAARGIEELAKAGVSTEDILGGGLDGALSLAAAGALEVGDAAEIAASALTQFKLEGSDVGHIADLLAAGAGKAQGSVHDLGMALNQSGLIASQTGLSIEETTGGLAAFASAGLVGSDAGTSFKTMLQRMNPQTEAAATLMDELGISAYDSQGNFIGLTEWAGKLQTGLSGMSEQQRAAAMQTLFGSDAIRAASVVYEQGADGIQTWIDNVNDAGYAAETAAIMQDNLAGDIEKLGGAIDTVFLQSGSGMNDALRGMVQGTESFVDAMGRVPAPILTAGAAITGIAGAGALLAGGLMKGISAVAETKQAMDDLGISADMLPDKLKGVAKAAGVAAGVAVLAKALIEVADQSAPTAAGLSDIENALAGTPGKLDALNASFANAEWANGNQGGIAGRMHQTVEGINSVGDAIAHLQNMSGLDKISDLGNDVIGMEDAWSAAREQIESVDAAIGSLATGGNLEGAAEQFRAVMDSVEASGGNVEEAAAGFDTYRAAIQEYATSLGVTLDDQQVFAAMMGEMPPALQAAASASQEASSGMTDAAAATGRLEQGMGEITDASGEAVGTLEDLVDALSLLGMIELDAQAATGAFHAALRDVVGATDGLAGSLATAEGAFDVTTEAGYAAQQAFAEVATSGWDMAEGVANAGGSFSDITGAMQSTYDGLVSTAEQFGFTGEQARALAEEALGVPENVDIETFMSNAALQMAEQTGAVVGSIDGEVSISTYMADAAFREALRTRAAALGIPEHEAISSFMESFARDEADKTTAAILGIPVGASISSWMDSAARGEAQNLKAAIDAVDGRHSSSTHTHYNVTVNQEYGSVARRPGQAGGIPERATGGRVPRFAVGGRLPTSGPGTDKRDGIMGISSMTGEPTAYVDAGEWVINRRSSDKHHRLLAAINRDDPRLTGLPAFAAGGKVRGLAAGAGEYDPKDWAYRWDRFYDKLDQLVGKVDRRKSVGFEDGSGTVKFVNGAIAEVGHGLWKITKTADRSAQSNDRAATAADRAANAMGGIAETARRTGADLAAAGLTLNGAAKATNAVAGTFREVSRMTTEAAQAILAATAKIGAQGQKRGQAVGGGLIAAKGEANAVWRGRHDQFEQAITKKYGGVRYSDIHEDGSGQIVLDDGRLIELDDGRWKFVRKFKYGAPARGRTLSKYAGGGRLPTTGPGTEATDGFLGISSLGIPTAMVDAGEWVVNGQSSEKYNALLAAVNRDDPSIRHLARHASGARAGSREYAAAPAAFAGHTSVSAQVDSSGIEAAVASALSGWRPMVQVGRRQLYGEMVAAEKEAKRR